MVISWDFVRPVFFAWVASLTACAVSSDHELVELPSFCVFTFSFVFRVPSGHHLGLVVCCVWRPLSFTDIYHTILYHAKPLIVRAG